MRSGTLVTAHGSTFSIGSSSLAIMTAMEHGGGDDGNLGQMVSATGRTLPLAAQIVNALLESGASRLEAETALGIVGMILPTLPISLLSENAASPDLFPPQS